MLTLKCNVCEREFSSMMLYDMHINAHDELTFLEQFKKVAQNEINSGRGANIQTLVVDSMVLPKIQQLKERKVSTKEKRSATNLLKQHKNTKNLK